MKKINKTEEELIESKRLYDIEYRKKNKEKRLKEAKQYREDNPDKIMEYRIKYKELGVDGMIEYVKNNKENNKIKREANKELKAKRIKDYNKIYEKENKLKLRIKANERKVNRKKIDLIYKLSCNIRSLISNSFRNKRFRKNTKTQIILGCSVEMFRNHLESKFLPWMNWENYGKYNGELNYGWDIDHIIPVSSGNTIEDIIKLNSYTNLQPLCSKINRNIKRNNINY